MTVYLKGCPLRCIWCHSPESISPRPEVVWYRARCLRCGRCGEVCPEGLRTFKPVDPRDWGRCRLCGKCVEACPADALEIKGAEVAAWEIVEHAVRISPFLRRSGGGVTLTGGEPTLQADFSYAILALCRENGIHTAVETCGYAPWEKLEKLASVTDLFLYDLKHPDEEEHRRLTGASNRRVLENLRRLTRLRVGIVVRVPLIPGCNDSPEVVRAIGRTAFELGVDRMSLLPFNPASAGKYSWFHRAYPLGSVKRQSDGYVAQLEEMLRKEGMEIVPWRRPRSPKRP